MSKSKWILTVRGEFSSAHFLRNYYGKCENLHGHNYTVEMKVVGDKLNCESELLIDFSVLKKELREELSLIDHINLNEIPPFDSLNPSSENLARYLYGKMQERLKEFPAVLYSITVGETERQSATYMEE